MSSRFYKIKCKCGNEQNVFSHGTLTVSCNSCSSVLAEPRGGELAIYAKIISDLG